MEMTCTKLTKIEQHLMKATKKETKPKAPKKKAIKEVPEIVEVMVEVPKTKHITIGGFVCQLMLEVPEMSNAQILLEVQAQFMGCKTSMACIAWYRSKLRSQGLVAPRNTKKGAE